MSLANMDAGIESRALRVPLGVSTLLRDLIHERTGIFFDDSRMDLLLQKLEPLAKARGCASFLDYYYALKDRDHKEWDRAWEALSVQETYFWREFAQIQALVREILPAWFRRSQIPFRIWSAACASGEEPYSIAMAILEEGLESLPVDIHASDASLAAIEKARAGVYREKAFRALPVGLREKYFASVPGGWKISAQIMSRVHFSRVNLLEPGEISPVARVHAIFCRNAFIYFSAHSIRVAVAMMAAKMPPGSYMFVGASESLLRVSTDFELREIGGALVYVRI